MIYERLQSFRRWKNIIKFVINNGKITRKEVLKILTIKETKAYELLYSLTQKGYLERKGKGRGTILYLS